MYVVVQDCTLEEFEDVTLVEFTYVVFTRMPGESYRRRIAHIQWSGSLLIVDAFM